MRFLGYFSVCKNLFSFPPLASVKLDEPTLRHAHFVKEENDETVQEIERTKKY